MWYPTDVLGLPDGRVVFTNGKHVGTGPNTTPGTTDILDLLQGSLTIVDASDLTPTQLTDWETEIATNNDRATRFNQVSCPSGATYDFPIPQPGGGAPPNRACALFRSRHRRAWRSSVSSCARARASWAGCAVTDISTSAEPPPAQDDTPDSLRSCQQLALKYGDLVALPSQSQSSERERRFEPKPSHSKHFRHVLGVLGSLRSPCARSPRGGGRLRPGRARVHRRRR